VRKNPWLQLQGCGASYSMHFREWSALFDNPVRAGEQHRWHDDAKRLSGVQIDHQLELGRLFDRQVGRLRTLEDFAPLKFLSTKAADRR
jgi:hypothetical protein